MPRLVQRPLPSLSALDEAVASVYSTWSEDMLLNQVRNLARITGYFCYHTRFSIKSAAGFPDCVLLGGDGRLIFAELKREGKWPTESRLGKGIIPKIIEGQRDWLDRLDRSCAEAYLWWPSDVADIAAILTEGPTPEMACVKRLLDYLGRE